MKPAITVELVAEPRDVDSAKLEDFTVGYHVKNTSAQVLDPKLGASELRVDGAAVPGWSMAIMNSGHPATWEALPPGETISGSWALGRELFPKPGDYKLELSVQGVVSETVVVHVK